MWEDGAKETAERAVENCDAHARKNGCIATFNWPKTGKHSLYLTHVQNY